MLEQKLMSYGVGLFMMIFYVVLFGITFSYVLFNRMLVKDLFATVLGK